MSMPDPHTEYLARLPADQCAALTALSARIRTRLPRAEACISYAMPAFRVTSSTGKPAIAAGFAAFTRHLGFYPFSGSIVPQLAPRLAKAGFKTSKSGVTFTPGHPLPDWALDDLIRLRLAEIG
ncbi:iron chaperone [Maritimibacter fusiformis]|uniref:DUF1801 domain-containing protein n=1 Tax=Maritimibacter fusiformis TaxID=2603819 RepID=A0A5D0RPN0_9RHOB|nr:DUF1801 domain-containing protein [Maritimibacter fusiformis]TYB82845.1 DUF1801 domain-containing protein [Maritimibacter fusiformis]